MLEKLLKKRSGCKVLQPAKDKLFSFCSRNKKRCGHLQDDPISSVSSNLHFPRFSLPTIVWIIPFLEAKFASIFFLSPLNGFCIKCVLSLTLYIKFTRINGMRYITLDIILIVGRLWGIRNHGLSSYIIVFYVVVYELPIKKRWKVVITSKILVPYVNFNYKYVKRKSLI